MVSSAPLWRSGVPFLSCRALSLEEPQGRLKELTPPLVEVLDLVEEGQDLPGSGLTPQDRPASVGAGDPLAALKGHFPAGRA